VNVPASADVAWVRANATAIEVQSAGRLPRCLLPSFSSVLRSDHL